MASLSIVTLRRAGVPFRAHVAQRFLFSELQTFDVNRPRDLSMTPTVSKITAKVSPLLSTITAKVSALVSMITAKLPQRKDPVPTVAVLRLAGMIADGRAGGRQRINYNSLSKQLDKSFALKNLKAVCVRINSPGGSPVQSELIAKRIQSLSASKGVPVYAFVEDVAASGGYFLACGAQEIYASESSIVGSIGVISQSFGFQEVIKRWGLESRLQTAGENKAIDNPFVDLSDAARERTRRVIASIHAHFIGFVKASRGDRLKGDEAYIFSGEYWTGKEALEAGLIDGIETDLNSFVEKKFGKKAKIVPAKQSSDFLASLFSREAASAILVSEILDQVEERLTGAYWTAKYR